ncbi:MAG: Fur family transcriptional regulator [Rubrobacteraceae bacterium]
MQQRGVRVTPQRAHVWRLLAESGEHFTAEEIWEKVSRQLPGIELSTVYRSLEALRKVDLVADSRLPEGPRVFEARTSAHPHLVCVECGRIFHPEPDAGHRLLQALEDASEDFEVFEVHVVARGKCAGCA